jgi:tetratricopeptide (TPR) repeat protein
VFTIKIAVELMTERIEYWKEELRAIEIAKTDGYFVNGRKALSEKIEMCISELPNWYFGYYCRAQFLTLASILEHNFANQDEYKEILKNYTKAIKLSPNNIEAYYGRSDIRCLMNDMSEYTEILSDLSKVIELDLNSLFSDYPYYMRGRIRLEHDKDYKGAIGDFTKALSSGRTDSETLFYRGKAKAKLNDYENAIIDFTKAIDYQPTNGSYYYERGQIREQLKDFIGAAEDFKKAKQIRPF